MSLNIQIKESIFPKGVDSFIHLKENTFAEYGIIYHINDGYSFDRLSKAHSKHQLLFQKFDNKIQQLNLMLIDSLFPIHIADMVLETLLNNISSFEEYINLKKDFIVIDSESDKNYFTYKFKHYIHYLLFSNISSQELCIGDLTQDKIYYLKDNSDKIRYFSVLELSELLETILGKLKIKIDYSQSRIVNSEANIKLKFFI